MVSRRAVALVLSGFILMSILHFIPSDSFKPMQQTDENSIEGISENQISALEALPDSVKVSGRTGNSTSPWGWAVKSGGSSTGIAVDSSGNAYVTGYFRENATFGSTSLTSSGSYDIFIAKLSSNGSWQWAKKAGGSNEDRGYGIAVDSSGNAYVTGYFYGTVNFGSISLTSSGYADIFIAKLSSSGSWQWVVKAGGSSSGSGSEITVDSSGNVYATGRFYGTATFGSTNFTSSGSYDIFIAKLDSNGSWQWAVKAGGSSHDYGYGIAVDSSGNAYATGQFSGTATFGSTSLTSSSSSGDLFIAKLSNSGSWQWAVKAGGSSNDGGTGIAIDSSGNAYVNGFFSGTVNFGSTNLTSNGSSDAFVAKLSSSGSWQWAVKAAVAGIAVDSSGNVYATGQFYGTATFGSTNFTSSGSYDIFIAKLDNNGSWQWAVQVGGSDYDGGRAIAVDSSGNAYITGTFSGTATFGSTSLTSSGNEDIFIAIHQDQDMDGVSNTDDSCPDGAINWISDSSTDHDGDGCQDSGEDDDDDDDGITDASDACQKGDLGWISDSSTDYDSDGCQDSGEDGDDDDDGITDVSDVCQKGDLDWTSDSSTDHDSDGCQDSGEDEDDDDDGITDADDVCQKGDLGWTPDSSTDYDSDGCQDSIEDMDDDDDGITDISDACQKGNLDWTSDSSTDHDSDGCQDSGEDEDDDDDGITDASDACQKGDLGWISDTLTDHDTDGCQDSVEDIDDDNDGITDVSDACQKGDLDWTSDSSTDHDNDGCQDSGEDDDDDNDGITDTSDACPKGDIRLVGTSYSLTDHDRDGCQDSGEDDDDDNDGITDVSDACQKGDLDWTSDSSTDHDSDGCQDSGEDDDDDNDGITDVSDACQKGDLDWTSDSSTDHDNDGCQDSIEDMDDDDDEVIDSGDLCPKGVVGWKSTSETDSDADGCLDIVEDFEPDDPLQYVDSTPIPDSRWNQWSVVDEDDGGGVLLLNIDWHTVEIDSIQRSDRPYFINLSRVFDPISSCTSELQQFHSIDLRNDTLLQEQYVVSELSDDVEMWICVNIIDWQDNVWSLGPVNVTPTPNMPPHYDGLITGSTVEVGAIWQMDLCAHFSDAETSCADLRFTASNTKVAISGDGMASWTPTPSDAALTNLTFTATDEKGLSMTSNSLTIEVDESKELISFMGISITASDVPGIILTILGGGATVGLTVWRIGKAGKAKGRVREYIIQINRAGTSPTLSVLENKIDKMFIRKKLTNDDVALLSTKIRNRRDDLGITGNMGPSPAMMSPPPSMFPPPLMQSGPAFSAGHSEPIVLDDEGYEWTKRDGRDVYRKAGTHEWQEWH